MLVHALPLPLLMQCVTKAKDRVFLCPECGVTGAVLLCLLGRSYPASNAYPHLTPHAELPQCVQVGCKNCGTHSAVKVALAAFNCPTCNHTITRVPHTARAV